VAEVGQLSSGLYVQVADMVKMQDNTSLELLAVKNTVSKLKDEVKVWKRAQQSIENEVRLLES